MGNIIYNFEEFLQNKLLEDFSNNSDNCEVIYAKKIILKPEELHPIKIATKRHFVIRSEQRSEFSSDEVIKKIEADIENLKQPKNVICHFANTRDYFIKDVKEINDITENQMHYRMKDNYDALILRFINKGYTLVTYPIPVKPNGIDITEVCLYINTYNDKARYFVKNHWDTVSDIRESENFRNFISISDIEE